MPQRYLSGKAESSTPSEGITNSDVAVEPSVTVIEDGLKVMAAIVVVGHGFETVSE